MATATAERTSVYPAPFGVEIGTKRNGDVLLQSIPGQRMRGKIDPRKGIKNLETGEEVVPVDQAIDLAGFPQTPGQQIHVDAKKGTYVIIDPLNSDEDLCERIKRHMDRTQGFRTDNKLKGVPTLKGTLDKHRMKSLCLELLNLIDDDDAEMVKGPDLTMEIIENMPGRLLLQPGLRTGSVMPVYADEMDGYLNDLRKSGG